MPWSSSLMPTQGGQVVWETEKQTPYFLIQRYMPQQNLIGGLLMTVRKVFRPEDVPPFRVITAKTPYYALASGNSVSEVIPYLQWLEMWLVPRLSSVRMPLKGSQEVFLADFIANYCHTKGSTNLAPLSEDDFRRVVGHKYPIAPPVPTLDDPILLALSKQQERTGQSTNPMSLSRVDESSMSSDQLDSYRLYQSCLGPAGAPAPIISQMGFAPPPSGPNMDVIPSQYNSSQLSSSQYPQPIAPVRPPSGAYPGSYPPPPHQAPQYRGSSSSHQSHLPPNSPAFVQSGLPNVAPQLASPIQNDWIDLIDDRKPGQKDAPAESLDLNVGQIRLSDPPEVPAAPVFGQPLTDSSSSSSTQSTEAKPIVAKVDDEDASLCKICFEREINTVILDCAHSVVCEQCGLNPKLRSCPICRKPIRQVIKIFKC